MAAPGTIEGVAAAIRREYKLSVKLETPRIRPEGTFEPRRNQHSSAKILHWLCEHAPSNAIRVLAITDVDLFIPILTFVFGEAEMNGRAAVVSMARLTQMNRILLPDSQRPAMRLTTECVHELGHTFGLVHCHTPRCAMGRSPSIREVDLKSPVLCPECRAQYNELGIQEDV